MNPRQTLVWVSDGNGLLEEEQGGGGGAGGGGGGDGGSEAEGAARERLMVYIN